MDQMLDCFTYLGVDLRSDVRSDLLSRKGSGSRYQRGYRRGSQPQWDHLLTEDHLSLQISPHFQVIKDNHIFQVIRRSDIRFGIWDLPQKVNTKAKFGPLGLFWDFFGTIFGPFQDL